MFSVYPSWDVPTRVHLDSVVESFISMAKVLKESSYLYFSVYFSIRTSYCHQENTWKLKMKDVINFFRFDFFGPESPEEKNQQKMVSLLVFGTRSQIKLSFTKQNIKHMIFGQIIISYFNSITEYASQLGYTCPNQGTYTLCSQ